MGDWIPCSERLPSAGVFVLFASSGVALGMAFGVRGGMDAEAPWFALGGPHLQHHEVTHWQPLPPPPEPAAAQQREGECDG